MSKLLGFWHDIEEPFYVINVIEKLPGEVKVVRPGGKEDWIGVDTLTEFYVPAPNPHYFIALLETAADKATLGEVDQQIRAIGLENAAETIKRTYGIK
jgi:hypothetical protein